MCQAPQKLTKSRGKFPGIFGMKSILLEKDDEIFNIGFLVHNFLLHLEQELDRQMCKKTSFERNDAGIANYFPGTISDLSALPWKLLAGHKRTRFSISHKHKNAIYFHGRVSMWYQHESTNAHTCTHDVQTFTPSSMPLRCTRAQNRLVRDLDVDSITVARVSNSGSEGV